MSLTDCQSLFILTWLSLDGRGRVSYRLHTVRPQCSPLHCCVTCTAHISTQTLYHKAGEFSVGVERLFPLSPGRVQGYRARVKMTTANKAAKAPQWGEGLAPAIRLWQSNSCFYYLLAFFICWLWSLVILSPGCTKLQQLVFWRGETARSHHTYAGLLTPTSNQFHDPGSVK